MELQHATISLRGVAVCAVRSLLDTSWNSQVVGADRGTNVLYSLQNHLLLHKSNFSSLLLRTNSEKKMWTRGHI